MYFVAETFLFCALPVNLVPTKQIQGISRNENVNKINNIHLKTFNVFLETSFDINHLSATFTPVEVLGDAAEFTHRPPVSHKLFTISFSREALQKAFICSSYHTL